MWPIGQMTLTANLDLNASARLQKSSQRLREKVYRAQVNLHLFHRIHAHIMYVVVYLNQIIYGNVPGVLSAIQGAVWLVDVATYLDRRNNSIPHLYQFQTALQEYRILIFRRPS